MPAVILCGTYGVFLADACTRFPSGWDGLHYHLPMAVRWVQTGTLDLVHADVLQCYPNNGMVLPYLLLAAGRQRLVSLAMVPQAAALVCVCFGLAHFLGLRRERKTLGVCLAMSLPIVVFQTFSSYVDLFGASAWLASLLALLVAASAADLKRRRRLVALAGLACGIALGSKLTYLVATGVLILVAIAVLWTVRRPWGYSAKSLAKEVGVFCLAASVCGGFWFVRNAARTGNPLFPFGLTVGDVELFSGVDPNSYFPERSLVQSAWQWSRYPWREHREAGYNYGIGDGLGAAFATFVPVGLLAAAWRTGRRSWNRPQRRIRAIGFVLVGLGGLLFLTVLQQTLRFALPLLILATLMAACGLEAWARRYPRWTATLLTGSLGVTAAIAALLPAKEMLGRYRDKIAGRAEYYEVPAAVDRLPPGARIVNVSQYTKNFALLGENLTNRVIGPVAWNSARNAGLSSKEALREYGADYLYLSDEDDLGLPIDPSIRRRSPGKVGRLIAVRELEWKMELSGPFAPGSAQTPGAVPSPR